MKTYEFMRRSRVGAPAADVFDWLTRPGAFERLAPPWEHVRAISRSGSAPQTGSRTEFEVHIGPVRQRWVAEHTAYEAGRMFRDEQIAGPFARWVHTHTVEPDGPLACVLEDRVEYALPLGALGGLLGASHVQKRLETAFAYRQAVVAQDVQAHRSWRPGPMHVLVTGASGLIGGALLPYLMAGGHTVARVARPGGRTVRMPGFPLDTVTWDPTGNTPPTAGSLEGFDAVVHLAGESIASGRWSEARKQRIRDSRVRGTKALAAELSKLSRPPRVLVAASAIGFYGDRGDENLIETSPRGQCFLAEVCEEWEAATAAARSSGIRTVNLRTGVVTSPLGGALAKMLPPFRMGAGGVVGDGRQWMSWITLDDLLDVILHAIADASLSGPVNAVAPHPVMNEEWTKTLGRVLGRPTLVPMPAFAARAAFGEMADELLLSSTRVIPEKLLAARHTYRYLELEPALRGMLGK